MRGDLLSPTTFRPVPAADAAAALVAHTSRALDDAGDLELVTDRIAQIVDRGTGADTQRRWRADGLPALVERAALRTLA
jgi:carboxylate-amine ligase